MPYASTFSLMFGFGSGTIHKIHLCFYLLLAILVIKSVLQKNDVEKTTRALKFNFIIVERPLTMLCKTLFTTNVKKLPK